MPEPDVSAYLLPNGSRIGWRRRASAVLTCSTGDVTAHELAWAKREKSNARSARELKRCIRQGFTARSGERARWLRVSQRGVTPQVMARRWSRFVDERIDREFGDFGAWLRVTGITKTGIAHAHVLWFGIYLPHSWLRHEWGLWTAGDDAVWVDEVKGSGTGAAKYLSGQFVDYLAGQGVRARWSCSLDWRTGDVDSLGPLRVVEGPFGRQILAGGRRLTRSSRRHGPFGAERLGPSSGLEFVRSEFYRGHDGPVALVYREDGLLRSHGSIADILGALT